MLGWNYLALRRIPDCLDAANRAVELSGRAIFPLCILANAEAAAGRRETARELLEEVEALNESRYVTGYALASMYLACSDRKGALNWLEHAWAYRDWWTVWLSTGPRWDELRSEPRFAKILAGHPDQPEMTQGLPGSFAAKPRMSAILSRRKALLAVAVALAVILAAFAFLRMGPERPPFQKARITKLTTNGTAIRSAVSPDGAYVAFSSNQGGKQAIYVRALSGSSPSLLAGPFDSAIDTLEFTRKGTHVAFVKDGSLFIAPLTGGKPELMMTHVAGPLSISPDGAKVAFIRANPREGGDEMMIADSNGTGERRIARRRYPDRFAFTSMPAWSPDSRRVACGVEGTDPMGFRMALMVFDVASGAAHNVTSPRWQYVGPVSWAGSRNGLIVIGQEQDASFQQLWFVPLGRGDSGRLTNDLNDYNGVTIAGDASSLVSVQRQTLSNVYVLAPGSDSRDAAQITPGGGRYFDLAWSPDGRIGYASDASGSAISGS